MNHERRRRKKIQNQEDEILNPQEEETVEGGVSDLQDGHGTSEVPLDGGGAGCDCFC